MVNRRYSPILFCLHTGALLCSSLNAAVAGDRLEVRVIDKHSGSPVEEAAVCVGTSADPNQFGARRTDNKGAVRFSDLLSPSLVVTASKQGYQGSERSLEPLTPTSVVVLKIAPGGGGPRCEAPMEARPAAGAAALTIDAVSIRKDPDSGAGGRILMSIDVAGAANQVRVSERPEFSDAQWQELRQPVPFELSGGEGVKDLYVQVRRHAQAEGASIEVVSPVERVRYRR